ncbi:MAG: LytTR family DNA-binding domain-containing protein [Marinilabiliales bacterium]
MNCIIIDDDKLSRKVIQEYVERTDLLNLLAVFESAVDAINSIPKIKEEIDLIFLDVEMPDMTGMEFLKNLDNYPQIIIVSAKEQYALEAFEYDVTDYLLKPVSYARFYKAIGKALARKEETFGFKSVPVKEDTNDEIFIKKNSTFVRLKYDDILFVEALENYIIVNTFTEKYTIHFTMKLIEKKLPAKKFKRVHRSYIVNINKIVGIEDNSIIIETKTGEKLIPIGKSYKDDLMNELNIITK